MSAPERAYLQGVPNTGTSAHLDEYECVEVDDRSGAIGPESSYLLLVPARRVLNDLRTSRHQARRQLALDFPRSFTYLNGVRQAECARFVKKLERALGRHALDAMVGCSQTILALPFELLFSRVQWMGRQGHVHLAELVPPVPQRNYLEVEPEGWLRSPSCRLRVSKSLRYLEVGEDGCDRTLMLVELQLCLSLPLSSDPVLQVRLFRPPSGLLSPRTAGSYELLGPQTETR